MQQSKTDKKTIIIDRRADKEISAFPAGVQKKLRATLLILGRDGFLREPDGKRLSAQLFEIRTYDGGQFRSLYTYLNHPRVIVLVAFQKKTQKTPLEKIRTAKQRLQEYKKGNQT